MTKKKKSEDDYDRNLNDNNGRLFSRIYVFKVGRPRGTAAEDKVSSAHSERITPSNANTFPRLTLATAQAISVQ